MLDKTYTIFLDKKFDRCIKNLPGDIKEVFDRKLNYFKENPSHPSLNTKPYSVSQKILRSLDVDQVYEFYINRRDYRCIFYVRREEKEIIIAYVGNHTQIKN